VLFDEIAYVYFTWKIYIYILAMEMASRGYQHFASCIGTLLFPVIISVPLKLRPYGAIQIVYYYYYYHKAAGRKTRLHIQNYACNGNLLFTMVLWKETEFPLCRAMEKRWKRNFVSRVSSVIVVIRLPFLLF